MNFLRHFSHVLIVFGYVAGGLFSGLIAGTAVTLGGTHSIFAIQSCLAGGALAGLIFGLRRCAGKKAT